MGFELSVPVFMGGQLQGVPEATELLASYLAILNVLKLKLSLCVTQRFMENGGSAPPILTLNAILGQWSA